jgi:hypothetical protein
VLRAACCVLRAACCVLRAACCVLRAADCGLRTADCGKAPLLFDFSLGYYIFEHYVKRKKLARTAINP